MTTCKTCKTTRATAITLVDENGYVSNIIVSNDDVGAVVELLNAVADEADDWDVGAMERAVEDSKIKTYTPDELEKISWKPFIKRVFKEGIIVYEQ